jgi:hypothetical protein
MEVTNKVGRQIGVAGEPALILDEDESALITDDQLESITRNWQVVYRAAEGFFAIIERPKPKPKRKPKRKPRILMSTEPKLIPFRPLNAAEAARKYNAEEAARKKDADSFDKTDIVSRRDFEKDNFDKTDIVSRHDIEGHVPKNGPINECGHVPNEILAEAIRNNDRVGVDSLALGRPSGDIFPPSHWMYDEGRDYFMSLPVFVNSSRHPWDYEIYHPPRPELAPAGTF